MSVTSTTREAPSSSARARAARDRHVPIGERALRWVRRYCDEVRPHVARTPDDETLFLSPRGDRIGPDVLSRLGRPPTSAGRRPDEEAAVTSSATRRPPCMLDAGADVRYVAEIWGTKSSRPP